MLQQLKSSFKRIINCNKYELKLLSWRQNQYLGFLIDPNFQGVNRLFLSFENEDDRKVQTGFYLPKLEINYCNVIIDAKNFFDQPVKSDVRTYDNNRKIATGQGDYYTTVCLLDYLYFKI